MALMIFKQKRSSCYTLKTACNNDFGVFNDSFHSFSLLVCKKSRIFVPVTIQHYSL